MTNILEYSSVHNIGSNRLIKNALLKLNDGLGLKFLADRGWSRSVFFFHKIALGLSF